VGVLLDNFWKYQGNKSVGFKSTSCYHKDDFSLHSIATGELGPLRRDLMARNPIVNTVFSGEDI